jgi:hypothetical protein
MFGQRQIFSLRHSIFFFLILLLGCLETKEGLDTVPETDFFQNNNCETSAPSEPVVEPLDPPESGMPLTPMDPQAEWMCSLAANPLRFTVKEGDPAFFYLQPAREITYCVQVERTEGYITLQHEEGEVERDGNVFTWCFLRPWESRKGVMAQLRVLALTPEAKIIVTLQRGEN